MDTTQETNVSSDSAILAYNLDPSTQWVIEAAPGFAMVKHHQGCATCNAYATHCMATKRAYEIRLDESDVERAIATAWPHVAKNKEEYNTLCDQYK